VAGDTFGQLVWSIVRAGWQRITKARRRILFRFQLSRSKSNIFLHSALNFRPVGVLGKGFGPRTFFATASNPSILFSKEWSLKLPTISICASVSLAGFGFVATGGFYYLLVPRRADATHQQSAQTLISVPYFASFARNLRIISSPTLPTLALGLTTHPSGLIKSGIIISSAPSSE
jgi:hypothetical protein